jgi:hypothetical protein
MLIPVAGKGSGERSAAAELVWLLEPGMLRKWRQSGR